MTNIIDSFTRADSTTTMGSTTTGQAWTVQSGTWGIDTNRGYSVSTSGTQIATVDVGVTSYVVGMTAKSATTVYTGLYWRYVDSNNYFRIIRTNTGAIQAIRILAGAQTTHYNSSSVPLNNGDRFRVVVSGNNHKMYINSTLLAEVTDSSHSSSTLVGLFGFNTANNFIDDFFAFETAGTATASVTANAPLQGVGPKAGLVSVTGNSFSTLSGAATPGSVAVTGTSNTPKASIGVRAGRIS